MGYVELLKVDGYWIVRVTEDGVIKDMKFELAESAFACAQGQAFRLTGDMKRINIDPAALLGAQDRFEG